MRLLSFLAPYSSAGALLVLGMLLFCSPWIRNARADEWNDTFSSPKEFVVTQNMTARNGPGNSYEALGIVPKGSSVWVTSITNGWHYFKLMDGRSAYIFRRYLKDPSGKAGAEQAHKASKKDSQRQTSAAAGKVRPKPSEKKQPEAEKKKVVRPEKAAEQPRKSKQPEPVTPPGRAEAEKASEPAGDYDEPIMEASAGDHSDETGQGGEFDEPLVRQGPETPLLAEIPQGPEDEPTVPDNTEQSASAAVKAVKPKRRPVRSSSFGSDGCESYTRVSFVPDQPETLLEGKVSAGKRVCYRFLGIEGNTVSLKLEPAAGAAVLDVYTPASGHVAEQRHVFSWRCASTGDKIIVVRAQNAASYSLKVKVQP